MKRLLLFAIILAVFAFSAYPAAAADFSVNLTEPETIYAGNTTNFSAVITNGGADDWFSVAAIGTYSSWISVEKQNIFIPYGSSASSALTVMPAPDALQNKYQYSVIVSRASDSAKVEKEVFVNVLQSNAVIIKDALLSCSECAPGETVSASVTIMNSGSKPLGSLKLALTLGDRTKIISISSLDFGVLKEFSSEFVLDSMAAPGQYAVDAKVMQDTSVLAQKSLKFTVPSLPDIKTVKNVSTSIFGNYVTLVSSNSGNAAQTADIKSGALDAWYSFYSGAKPFSAGKEYVWRITLAPNESAAITYSEIFWPVPLALAVLAFIGAYYYIAVSFVSIRKRIVRKHGREFSVSIHVKSGLSPMDNAAVRDAVPKEFAVSGTFESIKPVVRKTQAGTELVWRLGRLKSREERILHYRIKPVSAFTAVRLHPAELSGKRGEKIVSRLSGFLAVYGEQEKPSNRISVVVE
ncbi:MAG: hypothetical protein KKB25_01580 [Nanoarchaeota archaeon]|nr:hypothetical protein [Nanoarchaeota archaeon]